MPAATSQQVELLRAAIFQHDTPAVPREREGVRPWTPAQVIDFCTSSVACFRFICYCREICEPCGVAQSDCAYRTCECNPPLQQRLNEVVE